MAQIKKVVSILLLVLALFSVGCSRKKGSDCRVGIDPSWYPLELGGRQNSVAAFSSELLQEIGRVTKTKFAIVPMSWDNLFWGLNADKYEAVLSSLQPHLFYEKQYLFSDPYLLTGPVCVVSLDSSVQSLQMLKGKEVGTIRNSQSEALLESQGRVMLRQYDSVPDMLSAIVKQEIDAALLDFLPAQSYMRDLFHGQLKIATTPMTEQGIRLIVRNAEKSSFIEIFNQGLQEIRNSGQYEMLLNKWGLSDDPNFKVEIEDSAVERFFRLVGA